MIGSFTNTAPSVTYPLDVTGVAATNLVSGETQTVPSYLFNMFSYVIPEYCPFYSNGLILEYNDGVNPVRTLVEGVDYNLCLMFYEGTETTGLPLYGAIQLAPTYCSGTITWQYQTLGGDFQIDQSTVVAALTDGSVDPMPFFWDNISGDTAVFPYIDFTSFTDNQYPDTTVYSELGNITTQVSSQTTTYNISIVSANGTCTNNNNYS